ncbi:hypothetical protein GW721_05780 [Citrobacter braakii]|nr:hypothetical protein [Citrobacter braakii]
MNKEQDINLRSILDLNMMVIIYIRNVSSKDVVKSLGINEKIVENIKNMSLEQALKLTETNQLLIKINSHVIDEFLNHKNTLERI